MVLKRGRDSSASPSPSREKLVVLKAGGTPNGHASAAPGDANRYKAVGAKETGHPWEDFVQLRICGPIVSNLPVWVSPNAITLVNMGTVVTSFLLAYSSQLLQDEYLKLAFRVTAGLCLWWSCTLDCLDGMQARKTGQCSKLGEVLDHWTDSATLPISVISVESSVGILVGSDISLMMKLFAAFVVLQNCCVYGAQVVIYHNTKKFLHPPNVNGVVAQTATGVVHILAGLLFFYLGNDHELANTIRWGFLFANAIVVLDPLHFYYFKLGDFTPHLEYHLKYVGTSLILLGLVASESLSLSAHLAIFTAVTFRFTGTSILKTVIGHDYDHFDTGVGVWLLLVLPIIRFGQDGMLDTTAWLMAVYLTVRNTQVLFSERKQLEF